MKISALILSLSLLANLSFASLTGNDFSDQAILTNLDTANPESLKISLVGEWTKISQDDLDWGFTSLSIFADGKFRATTHVGQQICGTWEISSDGKFIAIHEVCEKTGEKKGTILAKIEMADGHTLTLGVRAGIQTFIQ